MSIISYNDVLINATSDDINALNVLASGQIIKTMDVNEANAYEAQCQRLFQPGVELLIRYQRGQERDSSGNIWYTFQGVVDPVGIGYLAQLSGERIILSRAPIGG